jgi:5-carboxymethyl-2-hydroxymuconate isomerase
MPQITVQFTNNIKSSPGYNELFSEIHKAINTIAGIKIENCKSRVIQLKDFFIGIGGSNNGFIHMEIKILEGRNNEIKSALGKSGLQILKGYFKESIELLDLQITVEIIDIQKNCYYKYPDGTLNY